MNLVSNASEAIESTGNHRFDQIFPVYKTRYQNSHVMNRYQKEGKIGDRFMNLFPKFIFFIFLGSLKVFAGPTPTFMVIWFSFFIAISKGSRYSGSLSEGLFNCQVNNFVYPLFFFLKKDTEKRTLISRAFAVKGRRHQTSGGDEISIRVVR